MGDPLSPILSGFFLEDLENKANNNTAHKIQTHLLGEICGWHTGEDQDKNTQRTNTHREEYLLGTSVHPTAHKLLVVRALYDHAKIVTDMKGREAEEAHIKTDLTHCQYPRWAVEKGRQQVKRKDNMQAGKGKNTSQTESKGKVPLMCIWGIYKRPWKMLHLHNSKTIHQTTTATSIPQEKSHTGQEIWYHLWDTLPVMQWNIDRRTWKTIQRADQKECKMETAGSHTKPRRDRCNSKTSNEPYWPS